MCVIIHFSPNSSIKKEHLTNAVSNNWNGFGLIIKHENKLTLIKEFDEKGTDPEKVWKLVEDNKQYERFLHVRYSTKGAKNIENTQPFKIYEQGTREVFFMHNGTLFNWGSKTDDVGDSDTLDYCNRVIIPTLVRWDGDYTDSLYQGLVIDKSFTGNSKGLFLSSDLDPVRIGTGWSEYKHEQGESEGTVWVSNTDYFTKLSRGPIFLRAEAVRKLQEAKAQEEERAQRALIPFQDEYYIPTNTGNNDQSKGLKVWANGNARSPEVIKAINDAIDHWDLDDPQDIAHMAMATFEELEKIVRDQDILSLTAFIQVLLKQSYETNVVEIPRKNDIINDLRKKHEAATHRIANLMQGVSNAA